MLKLHANVSFCCVILVTQNDPSPVSQFAVFIASACRPNCLPTCAANAIDDRLNVGPGRLLILMTTTYPLVPYRSSNFAYSTCFPRRILPRWFAGASVVCLAFPIGKMHYNLAAYLFFPTHVFPHVRMYETQRGCGKKVSFIFHHAKSYSSQPEKG